MARTAFSISSCRVLRRHAVFSRNPRQVGPVWDQWRPEHLKGLARANDSRRAASRVDVRGTIAFAFAVPNGRTTQAFINLRDNSATHDGEPFVPFGRVIEGMDVADALYADYGETSGSGIRAGKQATLFNEGNRYLDRNFPRLDSIRRQ